MAVSSTTNTVFASGNGSSATFSYPYYFFSQQDLNVYLYDTIAGGIVPQILGTNYNIAGTPNSQGLYPNGASVVFTSSIVSTTIVAIDRQPIQEQNFALLQTGAISSTGLTQQLDYLTLLIQAQQDQNSRAVSLPEGLNTANFNPELPSTIGLLSSGGQSLVVNSAATGFILVSSTSLYPTGLVGQVYTGNGLNTPPSFQALPPVTLGSGTVGTLSLTNGGTGGLQPQEWGVVFASSATQLATTNPGPAGFVLTSNASSAPSFQAVNISTAEITGVLPIANGGTGNSASAAAFNALMPLTTWGDVLYAGSGVVGARLPAGTSGFVLQSGGPGANPSWVAQTGGSPGSSALLVVNNLSDVTSKTAAFDNINPMTTWGDIIYAASGVVATRLAPSTSGYVLQTNGAGAAPSWVANSGGGGSGSSLPISGGVMTGSINFGGYVLSNVGQPLAETDGASKAYVDSSLVELNPISGVTYASAGTNYPGALSNGVLTITSSSIMSVDGQFITTGSRILLKDQTSGQQNGVYTVTNTGGVGVNPVLTRAVNWATVTNLNSLDPVLVTGGTINSTTQWYQSNSAITVDSSVLVFTQVSNSPGNYLLKSNNLSDVITKASAFSNITPQTTVGDLIGYGSSAPMRIPIGPVNYALVSVGQNAAWAVQAGSGALLSSNNLSDVTSKTAAFDNISPGNTWGDFVYVASGLISTRLPAGTAGQFLTTNSTTGNPAWTTQNYGSSSALIVNNLSDLANKTTAYNNIMPETTWGDIAYCGSGVVGTRLAAGTAGQFLQTAGAGAAPVWASITSSSSAILGVASKSSSYAAAVTDNVILCSGAMQVTLYSATGNTGRLIQVKKVDASAQIVTIVASSTVSFIDGSSLLLPVQYDAVTLLCDGANWQILDLNQPQVACAWENASSVVTSSYTTTSWRTKVSDPYGLMAGSSGLITVNRTGYWQVNATVNQQQTVAAGDYIAIQLVKNTVAVAPFFQTNSAAGNTTVATPVSAIVYTTAGDTWGVQLSNQNTTPSLVAGSSASFFSMAYIR